VAKAVFVNMVPAVSQCLLGWQARKYRVSIPVFKTKILIMLVVKAELYGKKKPLKKTPKQTHSLRNILFSYLSRTCIFLTPSHQGYNITGNNFTITGKVNNSYS